MKELNIFFFGFGQVAKEFIKKLLSEEYKLNISITTRQASGQIEFLGQKVSNFEFNNEKIDENIHKKLNNSDHILISIPPKDKIDLVLKYFSKELLNQNIKWITYLSATSVYGDHKGEWVDEKSQTLPKSKSGIERLAVENGWLKMYEEHKIPLQIFRLSGIYSNQYNVLKRLKTGEVKIINKKNHFFSRIHVEDIANALFKSLDNFKKGEIYNITKKYKGFAIAISPEGTRKKVERLKSGFLRIANETNSKIMMVGVDFSNKTIEFGGFFSPSGDKDKDLRFIKDYFDNFTGKRPELS